MLEEKIIELWNKSNYTEEDYALLADFMRELNTGKIRAATKVNDNWQVCSWVKKGILTAFKMGIIEQVGESFFDKHTLIKKKFLIENKVRIVPGGTSVRTGSYLAENITIMPPSFINIGAWIGSGCMIDSHVLVGTCAQIGKNVHLSAGCMIGGVLEPIGSNPVIIEDNAFIGGNTGLYEGVIVKENAVIAAGVVITSGTPVYDAVNNTLLKSIAKEPLIIPAGAVVVQGSRKLTDSGDYSVYCPIIIKYRDEKTDSSLVLEEILRKNK